MRYFSGLPNRPRGAWLAMSLLLVVGIAGARESPGADEPLPDPASDPLLVDCAVKRADSTELNDRIAMLLEEIASGDARARLDAVLGLARVGGEDAWAAMASTATLDEDPAIREAAIYALGESGHEAATQILEQALLDPDSGVRTAAVEALAEIGGDAAARALALALQDEDESLREEAVYALGEVGGPVAIGFLHQALADERRSLRDAAAEVLDEMDDEPDDAER